MNYADGIKAVQDRYYPDKNRLLLEKAYSDLNEEVTDVSKFVRMLMMEVEEEYTNKTLEAGRNVIEHLKASQENIEYRFQGSVLTQTHIKGASDIDILTITNMFETSAIFDVNTVLNNPQNGYSYIENFKLEQYSKRFSRYTGNYLQDLCDLRKSNEIILSRIYKECKISNPKAVKIHNLHFDRDVDVVTADWVDTIDYILNAQEYNRGISIYNKEKGCEEPASLPFLSIKNINDRSSLTNGRLKRMIRFLKNLCYIHKINLTSFEINAVCYSIPIEDYANLHYLELVSVMWLRMFKLCYYKDFNRSLYSVDGTERVFVKNPDRLPELGKLCSVVFAIKQDLEKPKSRLFL